MREIFEEYGAAILAAVGGILILTILGALFLVGGSPVAEGIENWGTEAFR